MKKKIIKIALILVVFGVFLGENFKAAGNDTIIQTADGNYEWIKPAYELGGQVPYVFEDPNDLFVDKNDSLYVADGSQVLIFQKAGRGIIITNELMQEATGIFVDENLEIYVADQKARTVFVFSQSGQLVRKYERPKEVYFGKDTAYAPVDVAVNKSGKIYIASTGTTSGLIMLDQTGKFLGFFGANESEKSIFSSKQRSSGNVSSFITPAPASISKVKIDNQGVIYTSTEEESAAVRKLNYAGTDIFAEKNVGNNEIMIDFWVDEAKNIYTVSTGENNEIIIYTQTGKSLLQMADYGENKETTNGLQLPSSIAVDTQGVIFVADAETKTIQTYLPTKTGTDLISGANYYANGMYEEGSKYFQNILKTNPSYPIANDNAAMFAYKNGKYKEALNNFENAGNKQKFSDSYYFIRETWINQNFMHILLTIIILFVIRFFFRKLMVLEKLQTIKVVNQLVEQIRQVKAVMKAPSITMYKLKYKQQFSGRIATIIYGLALIVLCAYLYLTDYLFAPLTNPQSLKLLDIIVLFIACNVIYQGANYLVARIMYGEGNFKQMYIANSLVYVPFILLMPFTIILSYVLTYNEASLYYALMIMIGLWMSVILFYTLSEIHNFFTSRVFVNILLTIFTIIVLLTTAATIFYIITEIISFIKALVTEVINWWKNIYLAMD
ncbi:MAG: YIP1 family protein [Mycoplasmatales bacterium]